MPSQSDASFPVPVYPLAMASDLQMRRVPRLFCSVEAAGRILKKNLNK